MNELKPCPFCGGAAELFELIPDEGEPDEWHGWKAKCKNPYCEIGTMIVMTKNIAKKIWNRRINDHE